MVGKIKMIFSICIPICILILCSSLASGASNEPAFRLDMKSLNLQKGVSATLTVSLINAKDAQIIGLEGLDNFDIISQSQSSSTTITNGVATSQVDFIYTIMPKSEGQFSLKAYVRYNGQDYETNTLSGNIAGASQNGSGGGTGGGGAGGAPPDIFVKTNLSREEAYLGEKIVLVYELYSRDGVESCGFSDYMSIDGMIVKDMTDSQIGAETIYIDGEQYNKYDVKKLIIDAIKPGACTIPAFNLQANVIDSTGMGGLRDPFGFGTFGMLGSTTTKYLLTEEAELLIKPLPTDGKPSGFSGIVGELTIDGQYSRDEMNFGESFVLRANVSGECNLDGLKNIVDGDIAGLTVYENMKNAEEYLTGNNRYTASKSFEAIMIPERAGIIDVPAVSISYFNPISEKYESAEIAGIAVTINGEAPQQNQGYYGGYQQGSAGGAGGVGGAGGASGEGGAQTGGMEKLSISQVSYTGRGADYIMFQIKKETLYIAAALSAIILVACVGALFYISRRKRQDATLKTLYKQALASDEINEIYNLFNAMIKHRYSFNLKSSTQEAVSGILHDGALADKIISIMGYMESPGADHVNDGGCARLKNDIKSIYKTALC